MSSTLSSSRSSLFASPASFDSIHDQVPPSRSISILPPFTSVSDFSLPPSPPAAAYCEASGAYAHRLDVAESSPILRPPEDPPPDVSDELRSWLHAYTVLGIEERSLSSLGDPPSLPSTFGDVPDCPAPMDYLSTERRTVFLASRMTLLPAADPNLGPDFAQPLCDVSILDDEPTYATNTSAGVACPTDFKPAAEYYTQSEPELPDPSCVSQ